jgi:hypothetical protein
MMLRQCILRSCIRIIYPCINSQPTRTATVLRRVNTPPLLTKGADVSGRITQQDLDKDAIPEFWDGPSEEVRPDPWYSRYEIINEDDDAVIPPVKVILMKSMEDYGKKGQVSNTMRVFTNMKRVLSPFPHSRKKDLQS